MVWRGTWRVRAGERRVLWLEGPVRSPLASRVKQDVGVQSWSPGMREGKVFGVFSFVAALVPDSTQILF